MSGEYEPPLLRPRGDLPEKGFHIQVAGKLEVFSSIANTLFDGDCRNPAGQAGHGAPKIPAIAPLKLIRHCGSVRKKRIVRRFVGKYSHEGRAVILFEMAVVLEMSEFHEFIDRLGVEQIEIASLASRPGRAMGRIQGNTYFSQEKQERVTASKRARIALAQFLRLVREAPLGDGKGSRRFDIGRAEDFGQPGGRTKPVIKSHLLELRMLPEQPASDGPAGPIVFVVYPALHAEALERLTYRLEPFPENIGKILDLHAGAGMNNDSGYALGAHLLQRAAQASFIKLVVEKPERRGAELSRRTNKMLFYGIYLHD